MLLRFILRGEIRGSRGRGEKRKVSVIWLLPRKTTRIKWFTIIMRGKNKIETILFENREVWNKSANVGYLAHETL